MKQSLKKLMFFLLALSIVLACLPATAEAFQFVIGRPALRVTETVLIPGAMDPDQRIRTVEAKTAPLTIVPYGAGEYLKDPAAAAAQLREAMKKRQTTATILYEADASLSFQAVIDIIWDKTLDHTGVGAEGDYLMWQRGEMSAGGSYYPGGQTNQYTIDFTISYYTTAEQEAWMDTAVEDLLDSLELDGLSDYKTLCAIYDWMCANITYDYANLENEAYDLKYTAYAALHDKTSVCQGYAVLLYRLLLEEGIDCRVITGTGNGGPHAWNIVELEGKYYNLDSTWDATYSQAGMEYKCFVCCEATFEDHARSDEYTTDAFNTAYPMGKVDYSPSEKVVVDSGTCGDSLTWTLDDLGTLTISGEGEMDDYAGSLPLYTSNSPWDACKEKITSVVIEDGVTKIGACSFMACEALTSVKIADSVTVIGGAAFRNCGMLKSIDLPDSVVTIDASAFAECDALESINLPDSVSSIGAAAFQDCSALMSIEIPNGVTYIGLDAFRGCSSLSYQEYGAGKYLGNSQNPYFALVGVMDQSITEFDMHPNTKVICGGAFYGCSGLSAIMLPENLLHIADSTFYGCSSLTSITIPKTVISIGDAAFHGCSSLNGIVIPEGIPRIGHSTFYGCNALTDIVIPDSVTSIGNYAFKYCSQLTNITIGAGLTSIGREAFSHCYNLTGIVLPDGVTEIGAAAFENCSAMTTISIPDSMITIGQDAFKYCGNLNYNEYDNAKYLGNSNNPYVALVEVKDKTVASFTIHANTKVIFDRAFQNSSITSVTIPEGVQAIGDFTFSGCKNLTAVTMNDQVRHIGNYAFSGCSSLITVHLPDSVVSIGNYAFSRCTGMAEIRLGKGLKTIGEGAFEYCQSLTDITIPANVTSIGNRVLFSCDKLESVAVPFIGSSATDYKTLDYLFASRVYVPSLQTVFIVEGQQTQIAEGAFREYGQLTNIIISSGVTAVGDYAFYQCSGLAQITVPSSVKRIGDYAFYGCSKLASAGIQNGVVEIGVFAFGYCYDLTAVSIPDSVTVIDEAAFAGCSALVDVVIGNGLQEIGSAVFDDCDSIVYNEFDGAYYLGNASNPHMVLVRGAAANHQIHKDTKLICRSAYQHHNTITDITIPAGVIYIGDGAFAGCNYLENLSVEAGNTVYHSNGNCVIETATKTLVSGCKASVIPADGSVTIIGVHAFNNCKGLTSIVIPDCITIIDKYAFTSCEGLTTITIPSSVTHIQSGVFQFCTGLTTVVLPNSVTRISNHAFYNCTALQTINMPAGLLLIGDRAFENCGSLTSIVIPEGVTSIGERAFIYCASLEKLTIPGSVQTIGTSAFVLCTGLTELTIQDGVVSIGYNSFAYCSGLTSVVIPDSVTSMDYGVFSYCTGLVSVTIGDGLSVIENEMFKGCTSLTNVDLPATINRIGDAAFLDCTSLVSFAFPEGITWINGDVFANCTSLTCVTIPESVTNLCKDAFEGCTNLWHVLYQGTEDQWSAIHTIGSGTEIDNVAIHFHCTGDEITDAANKVCLRCTCTHDYATTVTQPTCTEQGYTTYNCRICGDTYRADYVDARHNYASTVVAPTCTNQGYTYYYCTNCSSCYTDAYVDALGHNYEKVVVAPTCTSAGYTVYTCSACGDGYTDDYVDPTDHSYEAVVTEPTCIQQGYTTHICTECGDSYVDSYTDYADHAYETIVTPPTCGQAGYTQYRCTVCGYSYTADYIEATGNHTYEASETVAPTCQYSGYTVYVCTVCGNSYNADYVDPIPHNNEILERVEPTCKGWGYVVYCCTSCGYTQREDLEPTGHPSTHLEGQKDPTCGADGYTGDQVCDACGEVVEYGYIISQTYEHTYAEEVITEPTCEDAGEMRCVCTVCGFSFMQTISPTGHQNTHIADQADPTCGADGYSGDTVCDDCGQVLVYGYVISATGNHDYTSYVSVEPGCDTNGERVYSCNVCGDSYTEAISPTGHYSTHMEKVKEVTCLEDGYTGDQVCDICGQILSYGVVIPAAGQHSYMSIDITAPTCEAEGERKYECIVCSDTYYETIPATGHGFITVNVVSPTCGTDGYTGDTQCISCGYVLQYGVIMPATGEHNCTSEVVIEPTCDSSGWRNYHCVDCGYGYTEEIPAIGHTYTTTIVQPTCSAQGYTEYSCVTCGYSYAADYTDMVDHTYSTETVPPTCTETGYILYTCQNCGYNYREELAATGHQSTSICNRREPTCGADGYTGDTVCDACQMVLASGTAIPATGDHNYGDWSIFYEPTEYSPGLEIRYCQTCGVSDTREIPILEHVHDYSYQVTTYYPTCTQAGYTLYECRCGDSYTADEVEALGHTEVIDRGCPATCTSDGITDGSHCSVCYEVLVYQTVIPATGHSYQETEVAPTCTEPGYWMRTCTSCGDSTTEAIAPTGHMNTYIENAKDATCGGEGYTGDTVCCDCGAIVEYGTVIPASGLHSYNSEVTVAPGCETTGLETLTCVICGHSHQEEIPATGHQRTHGGVNAVDATCGSDGYTGDTVCDDCGEIIAYGTVTPASGLHSYNSEVTVAPGCETTGLETLTCVICGHSHQEEIPATGHQRTHGGVNAVDATCGSDGYTGDTVCDDCGKIIAYGTVTPASGLHSYNSEVTVAPGCETTGLETFTCVNCGYSYQEELPATGHRNTNLYYARKATCTADGYTGDVICDDCKAVVEYGAVIPATGHSYEMVLTEPTCTEDGSKYYSCHCGDAYTEVIPAIGHNYADVVTEPTCTEGGYTTHTCANCGASFTSDHIEPLDHSWDAGVVTKEPTEEEAGEKIYTCTRCGETRVVIIGKKQPVIYDIPEDNTVTIPDNDCFEGGTTVTVDVMDEGKTFETVTEVMESVAQKYVAYEFTATKDDAAVQPNGKLTVTFRIPEDYSNNIAVYYMDESGKLTKLESVVDVQSRTVTAELEHFSTYILADLDSAPQVLSGDVNGDGRVNARDARALLRYLAGLDDASMIDMAAADFNGDGRINARDARAILQKIAGTG